MRKNLIGVAAILAALLSTAAFAQENGSTPPGATMGKEKMGAFYSDETMKTMKPMEEFKSAFMAMSGDDQKALRAECALSQSEKDSFCVSLKEIDKQ